MNRIWARKKASPQPAVDRMQFVIVDFLKMFTAAVLCGFLVSIAAAGLTLLLSRAAEAHSHSSADPYPDSDQPRQATPGTLVVGPGCDGLPLEALERDWHVRIDGMNIEVRVMQTWIIPSGVEGAGVFQMQLPDSARLTSLSAQTADRQWKGQTISESAFARLSPARYLQLTRTRLLATFSSSGRIRTSPITGLQSGHAVVVQYTYSIQADSSDAMTSLTLPLQPGDDVGAITYQPIEEHSAIATSRRPITQGSVWVEWVGRKPAGVLNIPDGAGLERTAGLIDGLTWESPALQPGDMFRLTWHA